MSESTFQFVEESDHSAWEDFVTRHGGSLFHSWAWLKLVESPTFRNSSVLLRDPGGPIGRITGVLPILSARVGGMSYGYSVPFGMGGALFERAFDSAALKRFLASRLDCLQLNSLEPLPGFAPWTSLPCARVSLEGAEERIFDSFQKTTRYEIRHAQTHALEIRPAATREDFDLCAALYAKSMVRRASAGSLWPELFRKLSTLPPRSFQALLAFHGGNAAAMTVSVLSGRDAFYLAAGSDEAHHKTHANRLLLWESIRWARSSGAAWFQLAGPADGVTPDSLYDYKLKFGEVSSSYRCIEALTAKGVFLRLAARALPASVKRRARAWLMAGDDT